MLHVRVRCPCEGCGAEIRSVIEGSGPAVASCPRCGQSVTLKADAVLAAGPTLKACPACGGREFFVRRDFPQRIGLAIVLAAAAISVVFFANQALPWAWGTLAAAVLADAALYLVTGTLTVCYRCRAEFRGLDYNPDHRGFDLATSEKYG